MDGGAEGGGGTPTGSCVIVLVTGGTARGSRHAPATDRSSLRDGGWRRLDRQLDMPLCGRATRPGRPSSTPCAWSTAHLSRNHGHRWAEDNETDISVAAVSGDRFNQTDLSAECGVWCRVRPDGGRRCRHPALAGADHGTGFLAVGLACACATIRKTSTRA
jgi:hypothetical protein